MGSRSSDVMKATIVADSKPGAYEQRRSGNFLLRNWRATLIAVGGIAIGLGSSIFFLGNDSHEVTTGITSSLPRCEKNSKTVAHTSFEQPGATVDILIGNSEDKKVSVIVHSGADVTMEPSKGMLDITSPDATVPGASQDHKLRTYQAGSEVRTIEAIAAPHNQTELIVSKVCS